MRWWRNGIPIIYVMLCWLLLSGCGWQSTASSTGGGRPVASSTATPVPTKTPDAKNPTGCPSGVATAPTPADVVVEAANRQDPVEAHVGNVIELRLAFGQSWAGPASAPTGLEMQSPAGYADEVNKACVWRFIAQQAGTFHLNFDARALCKVGQMCAMYIKDNPVTIMVKG